MKFDDYKVADIKLAEWGKEEIIIAEKEICCAFYEKQVRP